MITQPDLDLGDPVDALVREHAAAFRPGFNLWLRDNRHIWRAFCREADRAWARGRQHYSARTIIEYLRHETALADTDTVFKINGNNVPDLARLYLLLYPARAGLFELRAAPGRACAA